MPDSSLPFYVERGGEIVGRPPFSYSRARLYGFVVQSGIEEQGRLLSRYLNEPSGGVVHYVPVAPLALITFLEMTGATSEVPADRQLGEYNYHEAGIWTLAWDARRLLPSIFTPYMFVNLGPSMANGREIYGYPKQMGDVWIDPEGSEPPRSYPTDLGINAPSVRKFADDPVVGALDVLRVQSASQAGVAARFWRSGQEMRATLSEMLPWDERLEWQEPLTSRRSALPRTPRPMASYARRPRIVLRPAADDYVRPDPRARLPIRPLGEILEDLLQLRMPMVFLKQFRDVEDPSRACYQAIVEAPARITGFQQGGTLPGIYAIDLTDLDSQPIRRELGFAAGRLESVLSFWMDFEMLIETGIELASGREIWRADSGRRPRVRLSAAPGW